MLKVIKFRLKKTARKGPAQKMFFGGERGLSAGHSTVRKEKSPLPWGGGDFSAAFSSLAILFLALKVWLAESGKGGEGEEGV